LSEFSIFLAEPMAVRRRYFREFYITGDDTVPLQNDATNPGGFGAADSLEALIELHALSVDTLRGFEKMVEKAEVDFRPIADRFSALHTRHVARLDNMVREMGGLPDEDGSFMGTVNEAVVTLRAIFDAIDSGVMDRVRSGEENVLAAFDRAIGTSLPEGHHSALTQMKEELTGLLDETRQLG
jgi:uncharacterized protein (TIGR02284 family)